MKAVVLVGGFGTRLRPLTLSTPKQMLSVVHRPMIERVVEHLGRHGIDTAILALGYRPDAFIDTYPDGVCAGVELHYAVEPEPLDTAGAIHFAALDGGVTERFLVVNGDVLTDLDIGSLIAHHDRSGAEGTIALHEVEDPSAFGVVPTDDDGRVLAFIEKPPRDEAPTNLINAGTYVLEPSVIGRIPPGQKVNVERVTFPAMVADGRLYALDGKAYWIDAGTPETYLAANLDLVSGVRGSAEEAIHPTAVVEGTVIRSVVSTRARVDAGAEVTASVLLAGAVVGAGATVRGSIVGPGAQIGAGSTVDGSVIGDGMVLEARTSVAGERVSQEAGCGHW